MVSSTLIHQATEKRARRGFCLCLLTLASVENRSWEIYDSLNSLKVENRVNSHERKEFFIPSHCAKSSSGTRREFLVEEGKSSWIGSPKLVDFTMRTLIDWNFMGSPWINIFRSLRLINPVIWDRKHHRPQSTSHNSRFSPKTLVRSFFHATSSAQEPVPHRTAKQRRDRLIRS
jgi:hypothetical protein